MTGRILKIIQESEGVVPMGAPLIEIGDPLDLEIVADLLSTDAVKIRPGAAVRIDGWGGAPIRSRVTRVDPAGFLKVSALGIEEQRVRTIIDFVDPPEAWASLGHDCRAVVHVTVWQADDVLTFRGSGEARGGPIAVSMKGRMVSSTVLTHVVISAIRLARAWNVPDVLPLARALPAIRQSTTRQCLRDREHRP